MSIRSYYTRRATSLNVIPFSVLCTISIIVGIKENVFVCAAV